MASRRGPDIAEAAAMSPGIPIPLRVTPMDDEPITTPAPVAADVYGPDLREFLGDDEPDDDGSEWLVKGLVAAEAPGVITGPPKAWKSLLMLHLAICIASGRKVFDRFDVRQGRVLVLEREDTIREARRRLWRIARGMGIDPRELHESLRVDVAKPFYFDEPDDMTRLRRTLDAWSASAVFVDSLRRVHRGDENSSRDMQTVTTAWADLCTTYRVAIVALHHNRKAGAAGDVASAGERMRGTGDLFALVRHLLSVESKKKERIAVVTADGNLAGLPEPFALSLSDGETESGKLTLHLDYEGDATAHEEDAIEQAVLKALQEHGELGARELREAVKQKVTLVDAAARRLSKRNIIDRLTKRSPWRIVGGSTPK